MILRIQKYTEAQNKIRRRLLELWVWKHATKHGHAFPVEWISQIEKLRWPLFYFKFKSLITICFNYVFPFQFMFVLKIYSYLLSNMGIWCKYSAVLLILWIALIWSFRETLYLRFLFLRKIFLHSNCFQVKYIYW